MSMPTPSHYLLPAAERDALEGALCGALSHALDEGRTEDQERYDELRRILAALQPAPAPVEAPDPADVQVAQHAIEQALTAFDRKQIGDGYDLIIGANLTMAAAYLARHPQAPASQNGGAEHG